MVKWQGSYINPFPREVSQSLLHIRTTPIGLYFTGSITPAKSAISRCHDLPRRGLSRSNVVRHDPKQSVFRVYFPWTKTDADYEYLFGLLPAASWKRSDRRHQSPVMQQTVINPGTISRNQSDFLDRKPRFDYGEQSSYYFAVTPLMFPGYLMLQRNELTILPPDLFKK